MFSSTADYSFYFQVVILFSMTISSSINIGYGMRPNKIRLQSEGGFYSLFKQIIER